MTAVRFERRGHIYAVTFIYDADLVELLKVSVPAYARSWNRVRREWLIEDAYAVQLADTMRRFGCTVVGLEAPPQPMQMTTRPTGRGHCSSGSDPTAPTRCSGR